MSKRRPGETKLLTEPEVRRVLAKVLMRLASELGVEVDALAARLTVWISFRAPGVGAPAAEAPPPSEPTPSEPPPACDEPSGPPPPEKEETDRETAVDAALEALVAGWAAPRGDEWSADWSKPRGGMLLAAMAHHGVAPAETLMIGYDFVDQEAASAAGVDYVDQKDLIGVDAFDFGFDADKMQGRLVPPGAAAAVRAPGSFAAERKSKEPKQMRSPQGRGRGA